MKRLMTVVVLAGLAAVAVARPTVAAGVEDPRRQELVDRAARVLDRFAKDGKMGLFRRAARSARGVFVIPNLIKAGFIFGGSVGSGVMLARETTTGAWSAPAFYSTGSFTFGFQAGGEFSEIVLLVMTRRGVDSFLKSSVKLGADISVAVGGAGMGAKGQLADVIAFSRTRGLYGGLNIEGAVIAPRFAWNRSYYGKNVMPNDILVHRMVDNPRAHRLRQAAVRVTGGARVAAPVQRRRQKPTFGGPPAYRPPAAPSSDVTPRSGNRDVEVTGEPLPWRKP